MIAGYADTHDVIFCADCWPKQKQQGKSPARPLDTEDPGNNFWIVDNCETCGQEVKYKAIKMLG